MSETRVSRNPRSSKTLRAARRISLRRSRPLEVSGPASRRSRWDAEAPVTTRPAGLPPRGLISLLQGPQFALQYLATGVDRQRVGEPELGRHLVGGQPLPAVRAGRR